MAYKRVLRYLKAAQDYRLKFVRNGDMKLTRFIDVDWACDLDDRQSISAYCIYVDNNLISWSSKKQSVITRSRIESEYKSLDSTSVELSLLQFLFFEIRVHCTKKPTIWCHIISTTKLAKTPIYHS